MDRIEVRGLRVFGHHGVFEKEQRDGQVFVVDVALELDLSRAASSDALVDTIDYGLLAEQLAEAVSATRFDLIEALASHLADIALEDGRVRAAEVRVAKLEAPVSVDLDEVAVVVRRESSMRVERDPIRMRRQPNPGPDPRLLPRAPEEPA